jgi:hypothetical protein
MNVVNACNNVYDELYLDTRLVAAGFRFFLAYIQPDPVAHTAYNLSDVLPFFPLLNANAPNHRRWSAVCRRVCQSDGRCDVAKTTQCSMPDGLLDISAWEVASIFFWQFLFFRRCFFFGTLYILSIRRTIL